MSTFRGPASALYLACIRETKHRKAKTNSSLEKESHHESQFQPYACNRHTRFHRHLRIREYRLRAERLQGYVHVARGRSLGQCLTARRRLQLLFEVRWATRPDY